MTFINSRITSIIFLFLISLLSGTLAACHYSCLNCTGPSSTECSSCSDSSRGYGGLVGYQNTCYCLGDYSESYESACESYSIGNRAVDILVSVELWIVSLLGLWVAFFNNQFMGFYCIDAIQTFSFLYYVSDMLPTAIIGPLYYSRYLSVSNFKSPLRSYYLEAIVFSSGISDELVIIHNQQLSPPRYTYYEITGNFIYNQMTTMIVASVLFILLLVCVKYQRQLRVLGWLETTRQTIALRIMQFFQGDILFFAILQCQTADLSGNIGSLGLVFCIGCICLYQLGVSFVVYTVNIQKTKFEAPNNQVFFNKLRKNDKINRNFFLLQLANKTIIVFFLGIFVGNTTGQFISTAIVQTIISIITVAYISLKKKRYRFFLIFMNIFKVSLHFVLVIFAFMADSQKTTIAWLFAIAYILFLTVMLIFLVAETSALVPEMIHFFTTFSIKTLGNQAVLDSRQMEMQEFDQNSLMKSNPNPIYKIFKNETLYNQVIQDHLDSYTFDLPEQDEKQDHSQESTENDCNLSPDKQSKKQSQIQQQQHQDNTQSKDLKDAANLHHHNEDPDDEFDPENCSIGSDD